MLTDPLNITDTFASGMSEVEDLGGGCFRFTLFARHYAGNREERVIVARIVMPREAIPPALLMAAKAVGYSMAVGAYFPQQRLH